MPVERYSLSSSPSSTLTSRSLCCFRRGKFFPQCTEKVNTRGSSLKMKAVPSPCWMQSFTNDIQTLYLWHTGITTRHQKQLTPPDAHLDPRSEPSFWVRRSGVWLQLPSHWGDKTLSHSLGKRGGFLPPYCRPYPSAERPQQLGQSHLPTKEKVSRPLWRDLSRPFGR